MQSKLIDISNVDMPKDLLKIPFYYEPTHFEMAYSLFESCNLHCPFCFEGHRDNRIDINKIREVPKKLYSFLEEDLKKYSSIKQLDLRLWGGELFYDGIKDEVFSAYKEMIDGIKSIFHKDYPDLYINFSWLSNGVWTKWERIKEILDYSQGKIGFSYDPANRFPSTKAKNLMLDNVLRTYNEGYLSGLSITLTKQTVKQYITGQSDLHKFPKDIVYDINFYTANPGWKSFLLSDDDIYDFFVWALQNRLFNINVISNLFAAALNKEEYFSGHYCECKVCKQYNNGFCTVDCAKRASTLPHKMFYGKYSDTITEENVSDIKLSLGMQKRGCLSCAYYKLCQKPCWIATIFEGYIPNKICPYAKIYSYICKDKELIEDFLEWRKND